MTLNLRLSAFIFLLFPLFLNAKYEASELHSMKELRETLSVKQPVVILFYAPWCGACKMMKEPLNALSAHFKQEARVVKINADSEKFKEAVDFFGVEAVPTIIVKHIGVVDQKELIKSVSCLLGTPEKPQKKEAPAKKNNTPPKKQAPKKPQKKIKK